MAQITVKNLSFQYPKADDFAINDVSFEIEKGQFVVLFGKSGCGKSTLLRNLKPLVRPFGTVKGSVYFEDILIDEMENFKQAEKIGFVMQSPEHQLVTDSVWRELAFGLENLGYSGETIRLRVAEVAEYFGIADWYEKPVETLSGGQKQLLNLAAAMVLNPEVLILDEPTARLDVIAAEKFLEMLRKINQDFGITIILSEHRLNTVLPMADIAMVMDEKKILCCGGVGEIVKETMNLQLRKLLPIPTQIYLETIGILKKGSKQESLAKTENLVVPISIKQGKEWLEQTGWRGTIHEPDKKNETKGNNAVIFCKDVWFRYQKNEKDILKGLSLGVQKGEIFALLGGNGAGKTTMMSLLSGIQKQYSGKIKIEGKTSYLPQDVQTLFCYDTVEKETQGISKDIVKLMQLEELFNRHPYDLSGGEQQKLGLAKVLKYNPDILLLDEATKGIDSIYKEELGELLKTLKKMGKTIILVSHDIDFCGEYADRCGLLSQGKVLVTESARQFFKKNNFYTTTVHKMAGKVIDGAMKKEDVVCFMNDNII